MVVANGVVEECPIDGFFGKDECNIAVGTAESRYFVEVGACGVERAAVDGEWVFVGTDVATDCRVVVVTDAKSETEQAVAAYGAGEMEHGVGHVARECGAIVAEGGHAVFGHIDALAAVGGVVDGESQRHYGVAAVGRGEIDVGQGVVDGGVGNTVNPAEGVATTNGMAVAEVECRPDFEMDYFDAVAAVDVVQRDAVGAFGVEVLARLGEDLIVANGVVVGGL